MPHLVVDITGHGFGHAGQTAPVIEALRRRHQDLRVTVRSRVPPAQLDQLFAPGIELATPAPDLGLAMHSPVAVDVATSRAWYERMSDTWEETVDREALALAALRPDLVISNVGFLCLAAAARCGLPAIAMSSLNWADIVEGYGAAPATMIERMRETYRSAAAFILLSPHLPTTWAPSRVSVGPVGRLGTARREEIAAASSLDPAKLWAVVSFGGIPMGDLATRLPALPFVEWLVDIADVAGTTSIRHLDVPFIDLLASADLVLTKTGYGLFVEPAAHGLHVLYRPRPDWPEAPYLEGWLRDLKVGTPLPDDRADLERLLGTLPRRSAPRPLLHGIEEAARLVEAKLYERAAVTDALPTLKRSRGGS